MIDGKQLVSIRFERFSLDSAGFSKDFVSISVVAVVVRFVFYSIVF